MSEITNIDNQSKISIQSPVDQQILEQKTPSSNSSIKENIKKAANSAFSTLSNLIPHPFKTSAHSSTEPKTIVKPEASKIHGPTEGKLKKTLRYTVAALGSLAIVSIVVFQGIAWNRQRSAFNLGEDLRQEIDLLRASGDSNWQEKAIALIRHSRKDNPAEELSRLRGTGVFDPRTERKLDRAQDKVRIEFHMPFYSYMQGRPNVKKLYAEAVEIKKIYQDTFDVFVHAQASPWLPITYLVKELWRSKYPQDNLHQFKMLRAPCSTASPGVIEATYRAINTLNPLGSNGIEKYKDRWLQLITLSDSDPKVREELLSADAFFFNYSRYESALHFLTNNQNILDDPKPIETVAQKAIRHFYPSITENESRKLAKKITKTVDPSNHPCGNLFVICIPKKESQNIQYRAHPFGLSCGCHPKSEDRSILDKVQNGVLDASTKCNFTNLPVPQYRLYLPNIRPDTGTKVFLLTPLSSEGRHAMKDAIHDVVADIKTRDNARSKTKPRPITA